MRIRGKRKMADLCINTDEFSGKTRYGIDGDVADHGRRLRYPPPYNEFTPFEIQYEYGSG